MPIFLGGETTAESWQILIFFSSSFHVSQPPPPPPPPPHRQYGTRLGPWPSAKKGSQHKTKQRLTEIESQFCYRFSIFILECLIINKTKMKTNNATTEGGISLSSDSLFLLRPSFQFYAGLFQLCSPAAVGPPDTNAALLLRTCGPARKERRACRILIHTSGGREMYYGIAQIKTCYGVQRWRLLFLFSLSLPFCFVK